MATEAEINAYGSLTTLQTMGLSAEALGQAGQWADQMSEIENIFMSEQNMDAARIEDGKVKMARCCNEIAVLASEALSYVMKVKSDIDSCG